MPATQGTFLSIQTNKLLTAAGDLVDTKAYALLISVVVVVVVVVVFVTNHGKEKGIFIFLSYFFKNKK